MTTTPLVSLSSGAAIPQVGLGVFQIPPEQTSATVEAALRAGYRRFDTAQMYGNERGVGDALAASALERSSFFVTTKLSNAAHLPSDAERAFERSLAALQVDYVDLFLVHWPLPTLYGGDFVSTWRTLISFAEDGRARSVGVSNFQPAHLERIITETGFVPAVNQVEVHPYFGNRQVRSANAAHGVATECWAPIAKGAILEDPTVRAISEAHGRTPSQVCLRWHVQRGDLVVPKTTRPHRMAENIDVFDFVLTAGEMDAITALDRGAAGRIGNHPDTFDFVPA